MLGLAIFSKLLAFKRDFVVLLDNFVLEVAREIGKLTDSSEELYDKLNSVFPSITQMRQLLDMGMVSKKVAK